MSRALLPPPRGGNDVALDDRADINDWKLLAGGAIEAPTKIIPFPAAHRCGEIRKLAAQMMNFSAERAESYLRSQMRIKVETMRRRGIAEGETLRQGTSFESAVRAELWRLVMAPREWHRGPLQ
jgi:Family of unknown function (DUF6074)